MPSKYTGKTRAEVKAMVLANNKGKPASDKSRQSMTHELKLWRSQNPTSTKKTTKNTNESSNTKEVEEGSSNYGQRTSVNPELARDETYEDYVQSLGLNSDAPAEDLYKKSGPPKRSTFKMKGWSGYQNKK
tara:strand:+ start:76 stop:468 length:393 start_codon:yes stop_codon:yes gene_type:complete